MTEQKKDNTICTDYENTPSNPSLFLFDVETTGPKRNFDRIISMSFLAYDEDGNLMGAFSRNINPDVVKINVFISQRIHSKLVYHKFDS